MCECLYACVSVGIDMCRGQKSKSGIILNYFPSVLLKKCLPLNLELQASAGWTSKQTSGQPCVSAFPILALPV